MKKIITYSFIIMVSLFCRDKQISLTSICGTFAGVEGGNNPLSSYVLLVLNEDKTCTLKKSFDLSIISGQGEWVMLEEGLLELKFNDNPVVSDVEESLMGGGFIEGTLRIKVLSKNKLKMGNTVLRRRQ